MECSLTKRRRLPPTNYFVPSLKPFLQQIFIDEKFYHFITSEITYPRDDRFCIPFAELPQLRKLAFDTVSPAPNEIWAIWVLWLALQLHHKAPTFLQDIQFSTRLLGRSATHIGDRSEMSYQDHQINALAESSKIILVFRLRYAGVVDEDTELKIEYDSEAQFLKDHLGAWYGLGKLDIRRDWW
ncbi:hypothetical protein DL96DRAFT_1607898 [Flagelloscypha sp. PMI_526]|nr:hypothetical protein DL96DRAFT_1607898 [Flagelloscypha sp. PMI_526]